MAGAIHRGTCKTARVAGDFHRPYENSETVSFYHSTGYLRNRKGAGDFHRPYGGSEDFIFYRATENHWT